MASKNEIITGVKELTDWWIVQRKKKLENTLSDTMSMNPFLVPFLYEYHNLKNLGEFVDLILSSHLMIGHNTGFGKLVDEKILPQVFGTTKLDRKFRLENPPLENSSFNEIDHLVPRDDGKFDLLSLKAGRWTIQLSMAIQLNRSFADILKFYGATYNNIVVGVYYGDKAGLTDKYEILRGINRGAKHHVEDLKKNVNVLTGNDFWSWLGKDENTQSYVLEGITTSLQELNIRKKNQNLLNKYKEHVLSKFKNILDKEDPSKWQDLLRKINS
ncbi:hypothetical protein GCM10027284_23720 [Cyclobacterium sediminis]